MEEEKAHKRALNNKLARTKRTKLEISSGLKSYVIAKLREDWSPEQVSGELKKQAQGRTVLSTETIYQFIYSEEGKKLKLWKHLRHRKKPERVPWGSRKKRKASIPNRTSIHQRPESINTREEFGHWEGDLMIFSQQRLYL